MLGQELEKNFREEIANRSLQISDREERLFGCLNDAFLKADGIDSCIIHGRRHLVSYTENKGWFKTYQKSYLNIGEVRCELADILVIAYSARRKQLRIFVVQNKVDRHSIAPGKSINASVNQYELLATRPDFTIVKSGCSSSLLRNSTDPSVALYGIFYQGNNGIEMSAITAGCLSGFPGSAKKLPLRDPHKSPRVSFKGQFDNCSSLQNGQYFSGAYTLRTFGDLIEDMRVGRPVAFQNIPVICTVIDELLDSKDLDISGSANVIQKLREIGSENTGENMPVYEQGTNTYISYNDIKDIAREMLIIDVDEPG